MSAKTGSWPKEKHGEFGQIQEMQADGMVQSSPKENSTDPGVHRWIRPGTTLAEKIYTKTSSSGQATDIMDIELRQYEYLCERVNHLYRYR